MLAPSCDTAKGEGGIPLFPEIVGFAENYPAKIKRCRLHPFCQPPGAIIAQIQAGHHNRGDQDNSGASASGAGRLES